MINVTVWNEFFHENEDEGVRALFPRGIHGCVADILAEEPENFNVTAVTLRDPDQGLPDKLLDNTDVLIWWGHLCHGEVDDALANRVRDRVYQKGMGFIALHSAHMSKPFTRIVGTDGSLQWGDNQLELVWNLLPAHPIAEGIPQFFKLNAEEMYGEPFGIPQPDELVFASWFEHGNIFRSGCCFYRGIGKVFYFQPGHETERSYYDPNVRRIIRNAARWAAPHKFLPGLPSSTDYIRPIV
jgi:Trehalose utilization protein